MNDDPIVLTDHQGRRIRLTQERYAHILEHPEMADQLARIRETVSAPPAIVASNADARVHVYHRFYEDSPVTRKYLQVAVKILEMDAFVLTAFFSSREKRGVMVWRA